MLSLHFIIRAAWGGWGRDDEENDDEEKDSSKADLSPANSSSNSSGSSWNGPASVSTLDREVFDVTNKLRTDPQSFIPKLEQMATEFDGNTWRPAGRTALRT